MSCGRYLSRARRLTAHERPITPMVGVRSPYKEVVRWGEAVRGVRSASPPFGVASSSVHVPSAEFTVRQSALGLRSAAFAIARAAFANASAALGVGPATFGVGRAPFPVGRAAFSVANPGIGVERAAVDVGSAACHVGSAACHVGWAACDVGSAEVDVCCASRAVSCAVRVARLRPGRHRLCVGRRMLGGPLLGAGGSARRLRRTLAYNPLLQPCRAGRRREHKEALREHVGASRARVCRPAERGGIQQHHARVPRDGRWFKDDDASAGFWRAGTRQPEPVWRPLFSSNEARRHDHLSRTRRYAASLPHLVPLYRRLVVEALIPGRVNRRRLAEETAVDDLNERCSPALAVPSRQAYG